MSDTLKLRHPILIDGKNVNELSYDPSEITNDLFLAACAKSSIAGNDMNASVTMEINTALHFQLGKAAVIAVNPRIDWKDLDRVKGYDVIALAGIGRGFISGDSEETSEESTSDELSETTPALSTRAQQSSGDSV